MFHPQEPVFTPVDAILPPLRMHGLQRRDDSLRDIAFSNYKELTLGRVEIRILADETPEESLDL